MSTTTTSATQQATTRTFRPFARGATIGAKRVEHWKPDSEHRLPQPLRWRAPRHVVVRIDPFDLTDEQLDRIFAVMALTPQHTYQVLTKRPERMRAYLTAPGRPGKIVGRIVDMAHAGTAQPNEQTAGLLSERTWPLPHVWLGVSAEDQQRADERIPVLLDTPAAVRWVSAEPLLAPIDFSFRFDGAQKSMLRGYDELPGLDWIVVGGESGSGARPFDLAWARSIRDQCAAAGAAFFMKQVGAKPYEGTKRVPSHRGYPSGQAAMIYRDVPADPMKLRDRKGEDPSEWPEDLRVREYPRGTQ